MIANIKASDYTLFLNANKIEISNNLLVNNDASFNNDVEISNNLLVNGDASFNANVEISNNLLVSGDASFNADVEISNNLIVHGDTSFNADVDISGNLNIYNNVDVSGDLILKGSFGVLNSSINDISYGTSGSTLTSNGFGNSLSWKEPVYYSAHLTSDITYNSSIYAEPQNVVNLTLVTESHPNSFDTTTGIFTAPRDGIYYVDYGVLASDDADPKEMYVLVSRIDFRTNNSGTFTQHTGNHVLGGNLSIIQSNVSSILQLNKGNQIRCVFQMTYNTGSNTAYRTKLIANYYHPSDSDRHSLRATRQSVFAIL